MNEKMESEMVIDDNDEIVINHYGEKMEKDLCSCPDCGYLNEYYLDETGYPQLIHCRKCGTNLDNY